MGHKHHYKPSDELEYFALSVLPVARTNYIEKFGRYVLRNEMIPRQKVNILFLGGGKRVSLLEQFIQAGWEENLDLEFFCYELSEYVHLKDRATVIKGKPFSEFTVPDLDILCTKHNINIVLPLMDAAVPVCARYKEHNPLAFLPVPEYNTAWACYDKLAFEQWIQTNRIDFYPWANKLPWFAKSRYGYGSRDQYIVKRKRDLREGYVVQDLLEPPEYTVDCYVNQKGRLIGISPRKRLLVVRGEVENSVTVTSPILVRQTVKLLDGRGFSGPVTVQYMCDREGNYKVTEVNARFGGGVILSIQAGADYPRAVLREYMDKPVGPMKAQSDILMLRSYRETFYEDYKG